VIWFFYLVQSAITTNYRALADTSDSIYFNKLSFMFIIRETVGVSVEKLIDDVSNKIDTSRNQLSFA